MLLVGVLGPTSLIAEDGTVTEIAARRQAEVLAVLAAHRGRPASAETIADLVWRGSPPRSAAVTLQGYVSRLRQLLEPGRPVRGEATAVQTSRDGYRLAAETDVDRFEASVERARDLLGRDPAAAAEELAGALARWRGEAYADVRDLPGVAPEVERTDELRTVARELHAQALLDAGRDAEAVPELLRLAAEHPLRERVHVLLATGLFRTGRQADALALFRELRSRLVDELGVDPGPEAVEAEQRLLRQDPDLFGPRGAPGAAPVPAPVAPVLRPDGRTFAGRVAELAALDAAWQRARSGTVVTAVVRGDAGIGKTTLVERLAAAADTAGAAVRWGRSPAVAGAPSYWVWQQVLGELPDPGAVREAGRFALGLEVARRLESLATGEGALVVLDDVQWADPDSLAVLRIALDALDPATRLLLVLTARDEPPRAREELPGALGALARHGDHVDLSLAGLSAEEAAPLVADLAPGAVDRLVARTGGNPFFLRSLAELDDTALPATVRDTVRQRVAALPPGGEALLQVLALADRELALPAIAYAAEVTVDKLDEPLEAARRGGLVEEALPGRLRITHDLVREAVAADLGPVATRHLHGRLADAFEQVDAAPGSVVAEHRLAAAAGARDDRAAGAALAAARTALASGAPGDARGLAVRGLAVAGDAGVRTSLHRVAGLACRHLGRLEDSADAFAAAAAAAREQGDWEAFAETALEGSPGGIGGYWALFALPLLGRSALVDEAMTYADRLPTLLRARLLAAAATQQAGAGVPGSLARAEEALAVAGDDPRARAHALTAWVIAGWTPDLAERRLAAVEELLALAAHEPSLAATVHHLHRCVLLELARPAEAARAARAFAQVVAREDDPDLALLETWWQIGWLVTRGDRDRARQLAAEAERASARVSPTAAMVDRVSRATIDGIAAWHDGHLLEAVPEAVDLAAEVDPDFLLVVALAHAEAGHADVALPAIDRLLAVPSDGQRLVPRTVMLTEALVALGDAGRLAGLLPVLESWGERVVVQWPGDVCMGPAALYRGSALAVLGERERARVELERAVAQAELMGAAPYAERARRRLASL